MIRFIDIGSQVGLDESWPRQFAFWNTVCDVFMDFGGSQIWHSWGDFEKYWRFESETDKQTFPLERFRPLCDRWVFEVKGNPFDDDLEI